MITSFQLDTFGSGFIVYSPFVTSNIGEGDDYISTDYFDDDSVVKHLYEGTILGFTVELQGRYQFNIYEGYPSQDAMSGADYRIRMGIRVYDDEVCIRDVYALTNWDQSGPDRKSFKLSSGIYHITIYGSYLDSPIPVGSSAPQVYQVFNVHFSLLPEFPGLRYDGIPHLSQEWLSLRWIENDILAAAKAAAKGVGAERALKKMKQRILSGEFL